jgi:iduronate 2-sulfatase
MGYSIRTDKWRYTEWQKRDDTKDVIARELYDHAIDPLETENVAADPANEEAVKELSAQIKAGWKAAVPQ